MNAVRRQSAGTVAREAAHAMDVAPAFACRPTAESHWVNVRNLAQTGRDGIGLRQETMRR